MMMKMEWFEVSREGLKELQSGKPKSYIVRELVANAWDEEITKCNVYLTYDNGLAVISVEDDSPIGFRNLKDSYTLFGPTYKRADPTKRGRFNLGEKLTFSMCNEAMVKTVKGTMIFDRKGRRFSRVKRVKGTYIQVKLRMKKFEFNEILENLKTYLVPKGIKFYVNGEPIPYKELHKVFEATLLTEKEEGKILKRTSRKTKVHLLRTEKPILYEMGIPVMDIDCEFSIDVQQKIPLSIDRETVLPSFMRDLYAEVLNQTHSEITEGKSSELWVREAISDERIEKDAVEDIVKKRYGDKVCVATPSDRNSIDEAISSGYNVLRGAELSKEEWNNIRKFDALRSSHELFGKTPTSNWRPIEPDENMVKVEKIAKKIAKRLLDIDLAVVFVKSDASDGGYFGYDRLTFNVSKLGKRFFENPINWVQLDFIIHELGHKAGGHTEKAYHRLLTRMAGQLIMLALNEPEFFNV